MMEVDHWSGVSAYNATLYTRGHLRIKEHYTLPRCAVHVCSRFQTWEGSRSACCTANTFHDMLKTMHIASPAKSTRLSPTLSLDSPLDGYYVHDRNGETTGRWFINILDRSSLSRPSSVLAGIQGTSLQSPTAKFSEGNTQEV